MEVFKGIRWADVFIVLNAILSIEKQEIQGKTKH